MIVFNTPKIVATYRVFVILTDMIIEIMFMIKISITNKEKELLKNYLKTSPLVLIRFKCQALLMRDKGLKLADIADIVSRKEITIGRWIKDWDKRRMASIFTGHENNENASKLTESQKKEIKEALEKPPSAYDIPQEFWSVPALKQYIKATFKVVYESPQSYYFLLSFSDLSFKYPSTFDKRRNNALIKRRIEEIREEIKPCLNDPSWEVFVSDEVRMQLEAETRRCWLKKGEKTIIKVNRERQAQSYIGFLNQKSFKCHIYELPWQNQEEILKIFEKFLKKYPDKNICIIWDNVKFHKGKEIQKALRKGNLLEKVHLINLPPYAPDENPIEHVWNTTKGLMANIQCDSFEEMKEVFTKYIRGKKFEYQI